MREGGPISYEARPSASFQPVPPPPHHQTWLSGETSSSISGSRRAQRVSSLHLSAMAPKGAKKAATTKKGLTPTACVAPERHPEGLTLRLRQVSCRSKPTPFASFHPQMQIGWNDADGLGLKRHKTCLSSLSRRDPPTHALLESPGAWGSSFRRFCWVPLHRKARNVAHHLRIITRPSSPVLRERQEATDPCVAREPQGAWG